jgi:hypothetical protein
MVPSSDLAAQEHRLPVLVRLRDGAHREEELLAIEEDERRDEAGREARQVLDAQRFTLDARGIAEPIDGHA